MFIGSLNARRTRVEHKQSFSLPRMTAWQQVRSMLRLVRMINYVGVLDPDCDGVLALGTDIAFVKEGSPNTSRFNPYPKLKMWS